MSTDNNAPYFKQDHEIAPSKNNPLSPAYYQNSTRICDFSPEETRILLALRFGVIAGQKGINATQILAGRLGSMTTAAHMHRLMSVLNTAWEGPFVIAPPCSQNVTSDEVLFCQMVRSAFRNQRSTFENIIGPLFARQSVPQIWHLFRNVAQAFCER